MEISDVEDFSSENDQKLSVESANEELKKEVKEAKDHVVTEKDLNEDKAYDELMQNNIETGMKPPLLVVVQGSEKSGKSTLINSLLSHYMGQKITNINGTVTINTSKTSRVTFIECPNTI